MSDRKLMSIQIAVAKVIQGIVNGRGNVDLTIQIRDGFLACVEKRERVIHPDKSDGIHVRFEKVEKIKAKEFFEMSERS